jgi:protein-S-isoprenylcysteine O-methyltransferase Ste14
MADDAKDNAGVVAPPPLIYLLPLLVGLLLNRRFPTPLLPRALARLLGWPLLSGGVALLLWFHFTLRNAGTPTDPWKPVERVVTHGPYARTRNPGYTAMAMIYASISLLRNSLWPMLLLPAAVATIHKGVIEREERYLEEKFGEEYRRYKASTPRWF